MLRLSTMGSFYAVLGIRRDASLSEIRRAYRKLAMKWHPDRCKQGEAKQRFQQIQEAYQVLSDEGKRKLYDAGLYDPLDDENEIVEGFADFVQEMRDLMSKEIRKEKEYSLEELQRMLAEMAQSFNSVPSFSPQCFASGGSDPNRSWMGFPWDSNPMKNSNTNVQMPSFGVFGCRTSYC